MTNYILVFFIALSGLFGVLSYHFSNAKAEAEQALVQVIDANTAMQKSLNLQVLSCKLNDSITAEFQSEKQVHQDKVQTVVSRIESLPKRTLVSKTQSQVMPNEEIDIDSPLPNSVIVLLRESCLPNEGQVCTYAK